MMSADVAAGEQETVVGPSRACGWLGAVLCAALTAASPVVDWRMSGMPGLVMTPAVTLSLLIGLWRYDLAPRLAYNAQGVAVRTGWRVVSVRWAAVESLWMTRSAITGDRIILAIDGRRFDVGLDRRWWRRGVEPGTAASRRRVDEMRWLRQRADGTGGGEPPTLHRFTPLIAAMACWGAGLAVALLLR